MFNIETLNKISNVIYDALPGDVFTVSDNVENPDAILVRSADMHCMELPENVLAVARAGAGTNNIPCDVCANKGIVVFNTPGANANAVKELVICGMLLSCRRVLAGESWVRGLKAEGQTGIEKLAEKGKSQFVGPEIKGKTLGIIGLGAIGRLVAEASVALGMTVIGYDPYFKGEIKNVTVTDDLNKLYEASNFISLHVPLNDGTKGMINADVVAKLPKGAVILNFARGGLVNNDAIKAGLADGALRAYVTDFASDELIGVDGVIAFPHLGASTPESEENCAVMASQELYEFLVNGNIVNSVNMPSLSVERKAGSRITVIAKEGTEVEFDGAVAVNSASKGGYTYTIADFDNVVDKSVVKADNVIRIRVI